MNKKIIPTSDFLFARPSALFGQARLFDFSGTFDEYNSCATPEEADEKAMFADWLAVGNVIESVTRKQLEEADQEEEAA